MRIVRTCARRGVHAFRMRRVHVGVARACVGVMCTCTGILPSCCMMCARGGMVVALLSSCRRYACVLCDGALRIQTHFQDSNFSSTY